MGALTLADLFCLNVRVFYLGRIHSRFGFHLRLFGMTSSLNLEVIALVWMNVFRPTITAETCIMILTVDLTLLQFEQATKRLENLERKLKER